MEFATEYFTRPDLKDTILNFEAEAPLPAGVIFSSLQHYPTLTILVACPQLVKLISGKTPLAKARESVASTSTSRKSSPRDGQGKRPVSRGVPPSAGSDQVVSPKHSAREQPNPSPAPSHPQTPVNKPSSTVPSLKNTPKSSPKTSPKTSPKISPKSSPKKEESKPEVKDRPSSQGAVPRTPKEAASLLQKETTPQEQPVAAEQPTESKVQESSTEPTKPSEILPQ